MDTLNHAAMGAVQGTMYAQILTAVGVTIPIYTNIPYTEIAITLPFIVSAFIGAFPDVAGFCEKVFFLDLKRYNWYSLFHNGTMKWKTYKWAIMLRWIPEYGRHIGHDSVGHKRPQYDAAGNLLVPGMRWWLWKERLWAELLAWGFVALGLFVSPFLIFIFDAVVAVTWLYDTVHFRND